MNLAPAGDRAFLVQLRDDVTARELHGWAAGARAVAGVVAVIPGHSSLYVVVESTSRQVVEKELRHLASRRLDDSTTRRLNLRVSFDGVDLEEFLQHTNQTLEAFLARVDKLALTARYLGFRGGFAYLDGWPAEWAMPRRPTSRPVPRGSFAIAGAVAGFYPIDTPGGWNLLGRTDTHLEHAIAPGDELVIHVAPASSLDCAEIVGAPFATVVSAPDWSRLDRGLPAGGPFDDVAAAYANRAVGNADDAPLLECAMSGPRLRFRRDAFVSWCGRVQRVRAGEELAFGRVTDGLRGYLAIGNREEPIEPLERTDRRVIRAMRGPHDVDLGDTIECEVTPQLDRVGIRMKPLRALDVAIPVDLRSCGMQCGTVQLHPDGSMVAMGPDHPVTGGYLQPMTVLSGERWKLAQLSPGERVTFVVQPPY